MLLQEIALPPVDQIKIWFLAVNDYITDNKSTPEFEVAIRKLLYVFPKCKYTGDMYRVLNLDINAITKDPTPQGLNSIFSQYKTTNKRNLFGWSKDLDQAEAQFIKNAPQKVGISIHQYHVGVDVGTLYNMLHKSFPNFFEDGDARLGLNLANEEGEVISTTSPDAQVIQVYVRGKTYSIQELPKVVKYLKGL